MAWRWRIWRGSRGRSADDVVVFVAQVNAMTARALAIARALSPDDLRAVTISNNPERLHACRRRWHEMGLDSPLQVVDSPYREFIRPGGGLRPVPRSPAPSTR